MGRSRRGSFGSRQTDPRIDEGLSDTRSASAGGPTHSRGAGRVALGVEGPGHEKMTSTWSARRRPLISLTLTIMLIVVEGVSAVGKSTWASRYAPAVVGEITGPAQGSTAAE